MGIMYHLIRYNMPPKQQNGLYSEMVDKYTSIGGNPGNGINKPGTPNANISKKSSIANKSDSAVNVDRNNESLGGMERRFHRQLDEIANLIVCYGIRDDR